MRNRGFALIAAIFVVIVFSVLGLVAVSLISGGSLSAIGDLRALQAYQIASGGINYAISADLSYDPDWSDNAGFSRNFNSGQFEITYLEKFNNEVVLQSKGIISGTSRTVQASVVRSVLPEAFGFSVYAGNQGGGPLIVQNTAIIDGDFYYGGDVTMKNFSTLVNGTMISNSLSLLNSATCASWEPLPVPPIPPPTFETSYYDALLQETTKDAAGALILSGSSVLNLSGEARYYTAGVVSGSARINGPGTVVIKGSLALQNSAVIGENVRLIAGGAVAFQNSVQVGASVEVVSAGDVAIQNGQNFPGNNVIFTYGDLNFDNTTYYYGTILAPAGSVTSVNSTKFRGLIYADSISLQNSSNFRGSVVVNSVGYFSNSTTVTHDPSFLPAGWPPGLETGSGKIVISDWNEVY